MATTVLLALSDVGGMRFEAQSGSGHAFSTDNDRPQGNDDAPRPTELLLAALAGCTGMDVLSILRKKRQAPASYEIAVSGEKRDEHPRIFTAIVVEHRVAGDVEAEALRRSIELSATKYCQVSAMLSARSRIEHRYRLRGADGAEESAIVVVTGPEAGVAV